MVKAAASAFDVCVIGGGPAGLAAAIAFRLTGSTVVVLDANVPPIDKACGEGLMPDTLRGLSELGVKIPVSEGAPFRGVEFVRGEQRAAADFPHGQRARIAPAGAAPSVGGASCRSRSGSALGS